MEGAQGAADAAWAWFCKPLGADGEGLKAGEWRNGDEEARGVIHGCS